MNKLLVVIALLTLIACGNSEHESQHSLIGIEFKSFSEIAELQKFSKVSDTVVYGTYVDPKHSILHLNNDTQNLILFNSVAIESSNTKKLVKVLDTLAIPDLKNTEFITIGYCQLNQNMDENLIAVVTKTDSMNIQRITKVWRANTTTNSIEVVNNLNGINCFNEFFVEN